MSTAVTGATDALSRFTGLAGDLRRSLIYEENH
jgi:hypothetical protein